MAYLAVISDSSSLPLTISLISLGATLAVAYFSNFKKSRPGVLIAPQISIYNLPFQAPEGIIWGGVGILIPTTFFNWSPNGGSVLECRITIAKADNPNEIFDIGWSAFSEILQTERRMGNGGFAQPLALPPNSSLTKTILFVWHPSNDHKLIIQSGRYFMNLLAWTKSSAKPAISESFEFLITKELANDYNFYLSSKNASTIDISIREMHRPNSVLTKSQANQIYGL
jgi:hypothetical protein